MHLEERKIADLVNEHSYRFVGSGFQVEVSTGSAFKPIKLDTYVFKPKGDWESELLRQYRLTVESEEQKSQLLMQFSVPVGLMGISMSQVKNELRKHVKEMVANPQYPAQTTAGDATQVPRLILEAVWKYSASTDVTPMTDPYDVYFAD